MGLIFMQDLEFTEIVGLISKEDARFDRKAYNFVRQALDQTVKDLKRKNPERTGKSQHVTGAELLAGIRTHALDQFGPLTKTVLNKWGITRCADFGGIVFNLIEYNVFSKTDSDRREDFADIYDFDEAFVKPFVPARVRGNRGRVTGSA
ncbi:MAG: Minf_1886 family protein [Burkholderiales bacterium]